ncbi:MAG: DUF1295 domain-containing protein [Alistipes sp.]
MATIGLIVFIALYFVEAGYGYLFNPKFGRPISNKVGWVVMEAPAFLSMLIWSCTAKETQIPQLALAALFLLHYFQRSFIFPFLMQGRSMIPAGIVLMGVFFNLINANIQGAWLFHIAPTEFYSNWFSQPYFWIGSLIFLVGMAINLHSDSIVRHLRQAGDTAHHIPHGGMFRYVSSANYFGEITEWAGFAIACWSWSGALFLWWTFANLAPRSASLYKRYQSEFGTSFTSLRRKRIIPFIY